MPARQRLDRTRAGLIGLAALAGMAAGFGVPAQAGTATLSADPATYRSGVKDLKPGDRLRLKPGLYRQGPALIDLHGSPGQPIVISSPSDGSAVFLGRVNHNSAALTTIPWSCAAPPTSSFATSPSMAATFPSSMP